MKIKAVTKTRCGTCRIRKIKCDQEWPVCKRCISTGRICDGYGIWGGGGITYSHSKSHREPKATLQYNISPFPAPITGEEREYLDWFHRQTTVQLPGIFNSGFWDMLIFQASSQERVVFHAALALAAAHKTRICNATPWEGQNNFALRQYNKAIGYMGPLFREGGKASTRVLLTTCVVFTCLEHLVGRYKIGQFHFLNGLKLLEKVSESEESIDGWLIETFSRLNVQNAFISRIFLFPRLTDGLPNIPFPSAQVWSLSKARLHLDRIIIEILRINNQHQQKATLDVSDFLLEFHIRQQHMKTLLLSWKEAFSNLENKFDHQRSIQDRMAFKLLSIYHTLAQIMANTCLRHNEAVFDEYTSEFNSIIIRALEVMEIVAANLGSTEMSRTGCRTAGFTVDVGLILPVFYTALKCRIPIRHQAASILRSLPHQEGLWNGQLASALVAEVINLEERKRESAPLNMESENGSSEAPGTLQRIWVRDIDVQLADEIKGNVSMMAWCYQANGKCEAINRTFKHIPGIGYKILDSTCHDTGRSALS